MRYRRSNRRSRRRGGAITRSNKRKTSAMESLPQQQPRPQRPRRQIDLDRQFFNSPSIVAARETVKAADVPRSSIATFVMSPPANRDYNFLQAICSDSNFCTAFGRETDRINRLFDFNTFKNMLPQVKLIASGANGFVDELTYQVNDYKAAAVLKTTISFGADNVYLEAYNGIHFINKFAKQFPCFLETYGVFVITNPAIKKALVGIPNSGSSNADIDMVYAKPLGTILPVSPTDLQTSLKQLPVNKFTREIAGISCKNNPNLAVLIQYIHNPTTLYKWFMSTRGNVYAFCVELPIILFQIYTVLATLDGVFTHFDLHAGNILLYKVPDNGYVTINYKNALNGATISLKTPYIVKIIDYGRSFLPDNQKIYGVLCSTDECTAKSSYNIKYTCGEAMGYSFFEKDPTMPVDEDEFYISTNRYNNAHDLRTVYDMYNTPDKYKGENAIYMRRILAAVGENYASIYGTPHHPVTTTPAKYDVMHQSNMQTTPMPTINNVQEMYWALCTLIQKVPYFAKEMNDMYLGESVYGTLDVDLRFSLDDESIVPIMKFTKEIPRSTT